MLNTKITRQSESLSHHLYMSQCIDAKRGVSLYGTLIVHHSFVRVIKVNEVQKINIINILLPNYLHKTYITNGSIINEDITFGEIIKKQKKLNIHFDSSCSFNNGIKQTFVIVCVLNPNNNKLEYSAINNWLNLTSDIISLQRTLSNLKNRKFCLEKSRVHDVSMLKTFIHSRKSDLFADHAKIDDDHLQTSDKLVINYPQLSAPSETCLPILW